MLTAAQRRTHERWLKELTVIPTAAGHEHRVVEWIEAWVAKRSRLRLRRDGGGNLFITRPGRKRRRPIFFQAHLDHPAFVVRAVHGARDVELEFRGGVHDPYFKDARIEIFDADDVAHNATITNLERKAKPFKRVAVRLARPTNSIVPGDIGRWRFRGRVPRTVGGHWHTHACDDLAAVAAALSAFDVLQRKRDTEHIGLLLTRAEEIGFIGTLAACRAKSIPARARLICLENSRSFLESPIGGGPIVRVGDRMSVFEPTLTNRISDLMTAHAKKNPRFAWQRKLMPGGACEATAFSTFGYESTCLCLPLGNYHNMQDIDAVQAGRARGIVGPEFIAISDFHGLVEMLIICGRDLDSGAGPDLRARLDRLLDDHAFVLDE